MEESILTTIKKMLGIISEDTAFDSEIVVHINTAFMFLNQLGVGPETVFFIEDDSQTWSQFITTDLNEYQALKSYIYLSVKLAFDPPGTSFVIDALTRQKAEIEWRLEAQTSIKDIPTIPEPEEPEEEEE